ncbi:MAG TPA: hypothetical protein VE974_06170 [Thermoanaerobaculia bacterium]|nr:hypothetical protein [Thermoanaerobaculia bacterium]
MTNPIITKKLEELRKLSGYPAAAGGTYVTLGNAERILNEAMTEIYEAGKQDGHSKGLQHAVIGRQAVIDIQTEAQQQTAREILELIADRPAFNSITAVDLKLAVTATIQSKYLSREGETKIFRET